MGKTTKTPLLERKGMVKTFPGIKAVNNVDFTCHGGEVHGLVGENGAGKSTLMKMLGGVYQPDRGNILINGREVRFRNYAQAREGGVGIVYQELSLLPEMSAAENIYMGIWSKKKGPFIAWEEIKNKSKKILSGLRVNIDPSELVGSLPMAQRQMVEIAKMLAQNPEIIIFDEPTAALSRVEVGELFDIIRDLKKRGKGIIFISHRIEEVLDISDTISVMKDGEKVVTDGASNFDKDRLIISMVGREFTEIFPSKSQDFEKEEIFSFEGIMEKSEKKVAFKIYCGEVLGIGGLQGQGQIELLKSMYGLGGCRDIRIRVHHQEVQVKSPYEAKKNGISLVPENKNEEGVFSILPVLDNLVSTTVDWRKKNGFIRREEERKAVNKIIQELSIRVSSPQQEAQTLSGGNLQKLVLGKWLVFQPGVIVMLEPTKGVDVATKQQIYYLIRDLAKNGVVVILYTSDMLELIGVCNRVLVMNHGYLTGELKGDEITEENIMKASVSSE
ncbi:MAG: sugar ABC transporter ATP-binding protein, partial [Spirochaetota bacterium]